MLSEEKSLIKNRAQLVKNAANSQLKNAREIVLDLLEEGIKAADPINAIQSNVKLVNNILTINDNWSRKIDDFSRIFVIGGGKACNKMAYALEQILGTTIESGVVNVPKRLDVKEYPLSKISLNEAEHPIPKDGTLKGTKQIIDLITDLTANDLVICLISGGGSSLMELPLHPLNFDDLEIVFKELSRNAATIEELNTIRKHLSQIKGGRLAHLAQPATVLSLIISDTPFDKLEVIASGPTAPDSTTWTDVETIFDKYNLWSKLPDSVIELTRQGLAGKIDDTIKKSDRTFLNTYNFIIANNKIVRQRIAELARKKELKPVIIEEPITGEAKKVGLQLVEQVANMPNSSLLICGGETTVTIKGSGVGGRNQELVLSAKRLLTKQNIVIASIGTDGIDGPTDAAGAISDGSDYKQKEDFIAEIDKYLQNNDSYNYFKKRQNLIITGYTGTNVSDITIAMKFSS